MVVTDEPPACGFSLAACWKVLDYGPASYDRTHVFTLAHTVLLPFGANQFQSGYGRVLGGIARGWPFNGITTVESGLPFSPTLSNNASLNSDQSLRPDITGDPFAGISQSRNQWFNRAAFAVPAPYTFGGAARSSLRGPNLFSADLSLARNFNVSERFKLQFRWEVYNAFNRTNLALPFHRCGHRNRRPDHGHRRADAQHTVRIAPRMVSLK